MKQLNIPWRDLFEKHKKIKKQQQQQQQRKNQNFSEKHCVLTLKWIGQYIYQAVHTDFAKCAKNTSKNAWLSSLNHLNKIAVKTEV